MKSKKKINNIHISIDDVINIWKDLTFNQDRYNSIFCNKNLSFLRELHNKYRVTIRLFCFYRSGSFSLRDVTSKFADELAANNDWLKFGFHSLNEETDYKKAIGIKAKKDYERTIEELIRITGNYYCIDRYPRLHRYNANLECVLAMQGAKHGIRGLLCAEDSRRNYYLDNRQNKLLNRRKRWNDEVNEIRFIKTSLRVENRLSYQIGFWKVKYAPNLFFNKMILIFTHENNLNDLVIRKKFSNLLDILM